MVAAAFWSSFSCVHRVSHTKYSWYGTAYLGHCSILGSGNTVKPQEGPATSPPPLPSSPAFVSTLHLSFFLFSYPLLFSSFLVSEHLSSSPFAEQYYGYVMPPQSTYTCTCVYIVFFFLEIIERSYWNNRVRIVKHSGIIYSIGINRLIDSCDRHEYHNLEIEVRMVS